MRPLSATSWLVKGLLVAGLLAAGGCESLQRKLVRKPKGPKAKLTPIIAFQDYSRAMTPLDRYRKHYLMFDYWNNDLLESLKEQHPNGKRLKRASADALEELRTLQQLLVEEKAAELTPLIEERAQLDQQLQSPGLNLSVANTLARQLETQSRLIHRSFFWRDAQDHLKPAPEPPPAAAPESVAPEE